MTAKAKGWAVYLGVDNAQRAMDLCAKHGSTMGLLVGDAVAKYLDAGTVPPPKGDKETVRDLRVERDQLLAEIERLKQGNG